jgi:mono/diheme cytochrome c family protein
VILRAPHRGQRASSSGGAARGHGRRQRTLFAGEKTIGRYGCFGCHTIKGFEKSSPIGVELTEEGNKLVERLDFGFEEGKIPHTLPGWMHRKLMEPRIFDKDKFKRPEELLRMPKFWLSDEEADNVVTGLMSFSKEQVPLAGQKQLTPEDRYVQEGYRLIHDYNCRGCHQVGPLGGEIREVVKSQLEAAGKEPSNALGLSPPMLWNAQSNIGEGARGIAWLHDFLGPIAQIRPWFEPPHAHPTTEGSSTLTRAFASMGRCPYPRPLALTRRWSRSARPVQPLKCEVPRGGQV